jgi:hypothetical protein
MYQDKLILQQREFLFSFNLFKHIGDFLTGLMRENAGRISYWKEIYFTPTLLRRASHLKRGRYVSVTGS